MPGLADLRLAVVIPAFQAARSVGAVVAAVRREVPHAAVLVVDDGSTDDTARAAAAAGATIVAHPVNRGKGAALRSGVERALHVGGGEAEVIVTLDADGQHDPAAIPVLVAPLAPLATDAADLVLGARARTPAMPPQRRLSNWLSSVLASRVAGAAVPDAQTGFRAFRRAVATRVQPEETGYDYELAFLLGAVAAGFRLRSVPIPTIYDDGATSHFRHVADTWRVARVFARYGGRVLRG